MTDKRERSTGTRLSITASQKTKTHAREKETKAVSLFRGFACRQSPPPQGRPLEMCFQMRDRPLAESATALLQVDGAHLPRFLNQSFFMRNTGSIFHGGTSETVLRRRRSHKNSGAQNWQPPFPVTRLIEKTSSRKNFIIDIAGN